MGMCVGIGWWMLARFIPPPHPSASAVEIAQFYAGNLTPIRIGMVLVIAAAGLSIPFFALISAQIAAIEGNPHILAYTQLVAGAIGVVTMLISALLWTTAAFRPERDPNLVLLLNDAGWLILAMPFSPAVIQTIVIGLAILSDKSPRPLFPRWVAFLNFWVAFLFLPAGLIAFFKTGPFAWNGILAFWLPMGVFGLWFGVMMVALYASINRMEPANDGRMR